MCVTWWPVWWQSILYWSVFFCSANDGNCHVVVKNKEINKLNQGIDITMTMCRSAAPAVITLSCLILLLYFCSSSSSSSSSSPPFSYSLQSSIFAPADTEVVATEATVRQAAHWTEERQNRRPKDGGEENVMKDSEAKTASFAIQKDK